MTDISFTEFSARLAVGDTLRILHSTYPGSELSANDYVDAREARVTRIGKRRVDLVNKSGKTHVVEATADVYTNLGATYKVATLRGYINVQHISLQIPKHVTDVEVYRWHHAHWGLKQVLATSCAHWNPMSGGWLFFGHDTCYARSEKELRYKFDMHHKKQQVKVAGPKAAIESLAKQWGLNEKPVLPKAVRDPVEEGEYWVPFFGGGAVLKQYRSAHRPSRLRLEQGRLFNRRAEAQQVADAVQKLLNPTQEN